MSSCIYRIYLSLLASATLLSGVASAQTTIKNIPLYYSLGGDQAVSKPASEYDSLGGLAKNNLKHSRVCSRFDAESEIQSIFRSRLNDTLTTLDDISQAAATALPGSILCRAKPTACQLLQHYLVRVEDKWNRAVASCDNSMAALASNNNPFHSMTRTARAQSWQQQTASGRTAIAAKKQVDQFDGCIQWIGGHAAGCRGKEPIWLIKDTVAAGWCLLLGESPNCAGTGRIFTNDDATTLSKTWPNPEAASQWLVDVLGDYRIQNGEHDFTVAGVGLLPKIARETSKFHERLQKLVYSNRPVSADDIQLLGDNSVVSAPLVDALRDLPDRNYLTPRIANEIALSQSINKAFLARRLLLSGMMEPNIQSVGAVTATIEQKIDLLEKEIQRAVFEFELSSRIISGTIKQVLETHETMKTPQLPLRQRPPQLLR